MGVQLAGSGSSYINRTSGDILSYTANYTFMYWAYVISHSQNTDFYQVRLDDGNRDLFYTAPDNVTSYIYQTVGGGTTTDIGDVAFTLPGWHHCAFVVDSGSMKYYTNGILRKTMTAGAGWDSRAAAIEMWIGDPGRYLDAAVSYAKAYDAALSLVEIQQEMQCGIPVKTQNLWGFWPFWSSSDLKDYSGNGRDFTGTSVTTGPNGPVPFSLPRETMLRFASAGAAARRIFMIS